MSGPQRPSSPEHDRETIHRIAAWLSAHDPSLAETDVLEAARRFVARWPGIAHATEVATLPVEQAVRLWTPRAGSPATATRGFDPEVDLVAAGGKPACLKEGVPSASAGGLVRAYRAMGLAAAIVERHGLAHASDTHAEGDAFAIVAVARDEATLAAVLDAQQKQRSSGREAADPTAIVGALMGYPACCVRAFAAQNDRSDNLDNERLTLRRAPSATLHPLLNRLAHVRLVSHHLCAADCAASIAIAETVLARLAAISIEAAAWVRAEIAAPVLCFDYDRCVRLRGAFAGDTFVVAEAAPIGRVFDRDGDFDLRDLARLTLSPHGVSADLRDGRRVEIAARAPILVIPGEPLAPTALAAIGGPLAPAPPREPAHAGPSAPLPSAIRPGVRVLAYRIVAVRPEGAGWGITLASSTHRFDLRVWSGDAGGRHVLRRGRWAIAVEHPEELPDPARAALTLLARSLPA